MGAVATERIAPLSTHLPVLVYHPTPAGASARVPTELLPVIHGSSTHLPPARLRATVNDVWLAGEFVCSVLQSVAVRAETGILH